MKIRRVLSVTLSNEHCRIASFRLILMAAKLQVPEATLLLTHEALNDPNLLQGHATIREHFRTLVIQDHPEALYVQGSIHSKAHEYEQALRYFGDALEIVRQSAADLAERESAILLPGVSFPAKVLYEMSICHKQTENWVAAVDDLERAAHHYNDADAYRALARVWKEHGSGDAYEKLLLKAASLGSQEAYLYLALYYWDSQKRREKKIAVIEGLQRQLSSHHHEHKERMELMGIWAWLPARLGYYNALKKLEQRKKEVLSKGWEAERALARHWFEVVVLQDPEQYPSKIILASFKHGDESLSTREEGYATLKAIEQQLSSPRPAEQSRKRSEEERRASADLRRSWKSIAAHLTTHWWSSDFRVADFEWPKVWKHYMPLQSPWFDLYGSPGNLLQKRRLDPECNS